MDKYNLTEEKDNKCTTCDGFGYTAEHDPNDPHEGGQCNNCPIQVECHVCYGTGKKQLQTINKIIWR